MATNLRRKQEKNISKLVVRRLQDWIPSRHGYLSTAISFLILQLKHFPRCYSFFRFRLNPMMTVVKKPLQNEIDELSFALSWIKLKRMCRVEPELDKATGSVYQKQIGQPDLPTYESMQALCILHLYVSLIRRQINSLTLPFDYFNGSGETNLSK